MIPLQIALSVLCALVAVWLVVLIVRDRTPDNLALNALGVIEVAAPEPELTRSFPDGTSWKQWRGGGSSTLTLSSADGRPPLRFTIPSFPCGALRAWCVRMGQPTRA